MFTTRDWALLAAMLGLQLASLALAWMAARKSKRLADALESELKYAQVMRWRNEELVSELQSDVNSLADHLKLKRTQPPTSRWEVRL